MSNRISISSSCLAITPCASSTVAGSPSESLRSLRSLTISTFSSTGVSSSITASGATAGLVSSLSVAGGTLTTSSVAAASSSAFAAKRFALRALYSSIACASCSGESTPSDLLPVFLMFFFIELSSLKFLFLSRPSMLSRAVSPALAS